MNSHLSLSTNRWPWILLVFSVLYLIVEFTFNATLLDTASGLSFDHDALRRIELFGRGVSGAGFALLILGALVRWRFEFGSAAKKRVFLVLAGGCLLPFVLDWNYAPFAGVVAGAALLAYVAATRFLPRPWYVLVPTMVMAWTAMFAGQKILIERFLIEPSDWQTRLTAQYMTLLKSGLAHNLVKIEGAPFDATLRDAPEERTFVALVGAMVMRTPDFLELVREKETELIAQITQQMGQENIQDHYARYQREGEAFQSIWLKYEANSKTYRRTTNEAPAEARRQYAQLLNQLDKRYLTYQEVSDKFHAQMGQSAEQLAPELQRYFDRRARCKSKTCIKAADKQYNRRIERTVGKPVPPEHWCAERSPNAVEAFEDGVNSVIRAPFDLLGKAFGDDSLGYRTPDRYTCDTSVKTVALKLAKVSGDKFKDRSGGYPLDLSREAFFNHQITAQKVRQEMAAKGVKLSSQWRVLDTASHDIAVTRLIRARAKRQWNSQIELILGQVVEPGLSYAQLLQQPAVQNRMKASLGELYAKGMTLEYSPRQFQKKVLEPATARQVREMLQVIRHEGESYANGAEREEQGKQFLRAVVIPPITLFLSLFFALLTTGKSLLSLRTLAAKPTLTKPRLRATFALVWTLILGALILAPLWVPNKFADAPAFVYFADRSRQTAPVLTAMTEWTIRMQPVMYPLGQRMRIAIEGRTGIKLN